VKRVELVDTGLHSTYAKDARHETLVLTVKGKPVLALMALSPDTDLENLVVTTHPKFQAIMARSQARYEAEGGLSTEQVRRHLAGRRKAQQPARRRSSRKAR